MEASRKDQITPATPRSSALAAPAANPINAALANAGYLDAVLQGSANLVSPIFAIDQVPEGAKLSVRMVRVRPEQDCYTQAGGKKALLKTALDQIAGAAQIDWSFCGQVDDWNDPHHVKYHAVAVVRNPDGTFRRLPGTKVIDLRKTADFTGEDAAGISDRELAMARKHIHSLAESKAKNRAIRSLGIPQSMSADQAGQPWIVVALVPDMAHPETRKAMIDSFAPSRALLYGHTQTEAPRALPSEIALGEDTGDTVDVSDMTEAPTDPAAEPAPEFPPDEATAPTYTLPIPAGVLEVADTKHRLDCLTTINKVCAQATNVMPPEVAAALFAKVSVGFDPLSASTQVMRGVYDDIRAEIARVTG